MQALYIAMESDTTMMPEMPKRIPTGIPRLDAVLRGGLFSTDTHLIYGAPGTGKTVLCHQLCFHLIRSLGARCVYLNLLTESPHEIIAHLERFSFYDPNAIPESLYYLMAQAQTKKGGAAGLVPFALEAVERIGASVLVFEGIENVLHQTRSPVEFVEMLTRLRALARLQDCTTILTIKQLHPNPALTIVDSIIELTDTITGPRSVREITVHKTRGSSFLSGRHQMEITNDGIIVHPRFEARPAAGASGYDSQRMRMGTGIEALDEMMEGGILSGSNLAIIGMPGAGKTTLGLSFLIEGAKQGQEGTYMGFFETPAQLLRKTDALRMPLRQYVEQNLIRLFWYSPQELVLDALAEDLVEDLSSKPLQHRRVFIDGFEGFALATVYPRRLPLFLTALFEHLHACGATTVLSENIPLTISHEGAAHVDHAEQLSESTIVLRYVRQHARMCRFLSVTKMRESRFVNETKGFTITEGGIRLCVPDEDSLEVLQMSHVQF